eukprot:110601-Karenia_brevis.AAC.1
MSNDTDDVASDAPDENHMDQLIHASDDHDLEPWPEFIKRATRVAETYANKFKIQEWPEHHLRKTWRWASRIARQPANR